MTRVYFVRHAQPDFNHRDDRTRPLTEEGIADSDMVLEVLKDKDIHEFYCSPYKRSIDTIKKTAEFYNKEIILDKRFREREKGIGSNNMEMFRKRWADHNYHEDDGESISMVQSRNIEALNEILDNHKEQNIVIGTHGTALSTIINYYNPYFDCDDFLRIIDWMPYVIEIDFKNRVFVKAREHGYIEKKFHNNTHK